MEPSQPEARLLRTKLYIPHPHPELVDRPALRDKLKDGLNIKLILVTAPDGYGKTTLLSTFVQHYQTDEAWISLDERDNEPIRYWSYFTSALQTSTMSLRRTAKGILIPLLNCLFSTIITG